MALLKIPYKIIRMTEDRQTTLCLEVLTVHGNEFGPIKGQGIPHTLTFNVTCLT